MAKGTLERAHYDGQRLHLTIEMDEENALLWQHSCVGAKLEGDLRNPTVKLYAEATKRKSGDPEQVPVK